MSDDLVPRNLPLERYLTDVAARAHGHRDDGGIRAGADARAWPGGVRRDLDGDQEAREEILDCSSYLLWSIVPIYDLHLAGDSEASRLYERRMRTLGYLIDAWHALHTDAA